MSDLEPGTGDDDWIDWGGRGPTLHLAHANGFPPASYRSLVDELTPEFRVVSAAARPLLPGSEPGAIRDWSPLVDDLCRVLDARSLRGIVGVGHSLGGTLTARAAARDPELFSALVLVDPVIFTRPRSWLWAATKRLGLAGSFPLVRAARRRRELWPDLDSVRRSYHAKTAFSTWAPEAFDDYLEAGFVKADGGGVRLRYPREWEARIFEVCPADLWSELRRIERPVLFIRGERSDTFLAAAAARARRELPRARVVEIPGTSHFVAFERPAAVAAEIRTFASEVLESRAEG